MPPWVGAPIVVSYPDFLNHVPDILQLGKRAAEFTVPMPLPRARYQVPRQRSTHLHDEHVFSPPLKVQTSLPLVDAQVLLLRAHTLLAVQHYEDVSICSGAEHIAGENLDLVRYNWNERGIDDIFA